MSDTETRRVQLKEFGEELVFTFPPLIPLPSDLHTLYFEVFAVSQI